MVALKAIAWSAPTCDGLAAPDRAIAVLERAIAADPSAAAAHARLGGVFLDLYDFESAARAFEAALRCDPSSGQVCVQFARCLNVLGRPADVLKVLSTGATDDAQWRAEAHFQRGIALLDLDRAAEAEAGFAAALAGNRNHRRACMKLCQVLRRGARISELLSLCEDLAAQGVCHAQLLLDWARALALSGDIGRARALLFDPARVSVTSLAMPDGFDEVLSEDILTNRFPIRQFPSGEEANRGSVRVHHLMCGARPERVAALLAAIQAAVDAYVAGLEARGDFDPWAEAAPASAHLHPWGLIQRGGDYEDWHTHRGGWLSGVYYLRIPKGLSVERGCIEFGPPPSLAGRPDNVIVSRRYPPAESMLILAPSHYHHRTIPSGLDDYRVSFAFDVVPDDKPTIS